MMVKDFVRTVVLLAKLASYSFYLRTSFGYIE